MVRSQILERRLERLEMSQFHAYNVDASPGELRWQRDLYNVFAAILRQGKKIKGNGWCDSFESSGRNGGDAIWVMRQEEADGGDGNERVELNLFATYTYFVIL